MQEAPTAATQSRATLVDIEGRDALGNRVTAAFASDLSATLTPTGPSVTFTDGAAGLAELSFSSASTGTFSVQVFLSGTEIAGSPLSITVQASLTESTAQTIAWGSFLDGARLAKFCFCALFSFCSATCLFCILAPAAACRAMRARTHLRSLFEGIPAHV